MTRLSPFIHPILYYKKKWRHHKCKYSVAPKGQVIKEIKGVKILLDLDLGKNIKSMLYDSYEVEIAHIMNKHLKPDGVFIDVVANVGYLTAIGAAPYMILRFP